MVNVLGSHTSRHRLDQFLPLVADPERPHRVVPDQRVPAEIGAVAIVQL